MPLNKSINRRDFLKLLGGAAVTGVLSGCSLSPSPASTEQPKSEKGLAPKAVADVEVLEMSNRPNIVFLMVDDLDSLLGTTDYMPHLKAEIADQGLTFEQFFVTSPLCSPSRATFLNGQYTHSHGVLRNEPPSGGFEELNLSGKESSTVATWLQAAGYRTAFMGKYLNGYPWKDAKVYSPAGWSEWISAAAGKPYYEYDYTLNENGTLVDYGHEPQDYLTDVLSAKAKEFITRSASSPEPFFLYLTPYAPHGPFTPAPRHAELFQDLIAPRTPAFNEEDVSQKPSQIRNDPLLSEADIQELDKIYRLRVQAMQAVDEMIAMLITTLKEIGQLDNTYVIFTSDNGFHMGQHRQRNGKDLPYEEDIRVPFLVRGPGIPAGQVINEFLVGNVDFAPTIAELAGVVPPNYVDGRSLVPFFGDRKPELSQWRKVYPLEFYPHKVDEGEDPTSPAYLAARTQDFLFVEHRTGFREFYDLKTDPDQLYNLADSTDKDFLDQVSAWMVAFHVSQGQGCRELENNFPQF